MRFTFGSSLSIGVIALALSIGSAGAVLAQSDSVRTATGDSASSSGGMTAEKCRRLDSVVDSHIVRFNKYIETNTLTLKAVQNRIAAIEATMSGKGLDASRLTDIRQTLSERAATLSEESNTYLTSLESIKEMTCGHTAAEYLRRVKTVRASDNQVRVAKASVSAYYDKLVRPELGNVKRKLAALKASEAASVKVSETTTRSGD
jgi:hypothetical protein